MQIVEIASSVTEGQITNVVFDACRANEDRNERNINGFNVRFNLKANGEYQVTVRNAEVVVVAFANVDEFDI